MPGCLNHGGEIDPVIVGASPERGNSGGRISGLFLFLTSSPPPLLASGILGGVWHENMQQWLDASRGRVWPALVPLGVSPSPPRAFVHDVMD